MDYAYLRVQHYYDDDHFVLSIPAENRGSSLRCIAELARRSAGRADGSYIYAKQQHLTPADGEGACGNAGTCLSKCLEVETKRDTTAKGEDST
jgi:hypothetical protein